MSHSYFGNPDYESVYRGEMEARDHVIRHMLPLLKQQGIEGRPLFTLHDDGRLTAHVILRVPTQDGGCLPVLAPVTLLGTDDLAKYVEVKGGRWAMKSRPVLKGIAASLTVKQNHEFGPTGPMP